VSLHQLLTFTTYAGFVLSLFFAGFVFGLLRYYHIAVSKQKEQQLKNKKLYRQQMRLKMINQNLSKELKALFQRHQKSTCSLGISEEREAPLRKEKNGDRISLLNQLPS
jgi:Tfp pilus assembly protein PilN